MWRKGNPCTLLVGMEIGAAILEKSVEVLQKKLKLDPPIPPLGICLKEAKSVSQRDIYNPMFFAALVTRAKIWKQPTCPSMDKWIK